MDARPPVLALLFACLTSINLGALAITRVALMPRWRIVARDATAWERFRRWVLTAAMEFIVGRWTYGSHVWERPAARMDSRDRGELEMLRWVHFSRRCVQCHERIGQHMQIASWVDDAFVLREVAQRTL
jgi:hypothetical protein